MTTFATENAIDWQIPEVQMLFKGRQVSLHETLKGSRGLIFGVPGAFTPVCTQRHLPGFRDCMSILRQAVHFVGCVAVNDPYVLKAWTKELNCPQDLVMISDWEGKFTRALGLDLDATAFHMGLRCRRFCILVDNDTIVWFGLEEDAFVEKAAYTLKQLGHITEAQYQEIEEIAIRLRNHQPSTTGEDTNEDDDEAEEDDEEGHCGCEDGEHDDQWAEEEEDDDDEETEGDEESDDDEEELTSDDAGVLMSEEAGECSSGEDS